MTGPRALLAFAAIGAAGAWVARGRSAPPTPAATPSPRDALARGAPTPFPQPVHVLDTPARTVVSGSVLGEFTAVDRVHARGKEIYVHFDVTNLGRVPLTEYDGQTPGPYRWRAIDANGVACADRVVESAVRGDSLRLLPQRSHGDTFALVPTCFEAPDAGTGLRRYRITMVWTASRHDAAGRDLGCGDARPPSRSRASAPAAAVDACARIESSFTITINP